MRAARTMSNKLSFVDLWRDIAADSSREEHDWTFVFEDDVAVATEANATSGGGGSAPVFNISDYGPLLRELLSNRRVRDVDGIVYLGSCGPTFPPTPDPVLRHGPDGFLTSRRQHGFCMHATGVTKWRARSMYADVVSFVQQPNQQVDALDVSMNSWAKRSGIYPYLFGADRTSPQARDHRGLVYQDRISHPTTIK